MVRNSDICKNATNGKTYELLIRLMAQNLSFAEMSYEVQF